VATNKITSKGKANFVLWSGATYDAANDKLTLPKRYFAVSTTGKLYTADAEINGKVTADSGSIGGWKISTNQLQNETGTIYLNSSTGTIYGATISGGSININNSFKVDSTGKLTASGAEIGGTISSSTISGSTFTGGKYYDADQNCLLYLYSDPNN